MADIDLHLANLDKTSIKQALTTLGEILAKVGSICTALGGSVAAAVFNAVGNFLTLSADWLSTILSAVLQMQSQGKDRQEINAKIMAALPHMEVA